MVRLTSFAHHKWFENRPNWRAIANGLTLTVAMALGLSFGKALKEDAKEVVKQLKEHLEEK